MAAAAAATATATTGFQVSYRNTYVICMVTNGELTNRELLVKQQARKSEGWIYMV